MRMFGRVIAALTLALGVAAGSAAPVTAAPADPAVTSCPFTPLYRSYEDGRLSDISYYYARGTEVTVTGGDGYAWHVTVNSNGAHGWMANACLLFIA